MQYVGGMREQNRGDGSRWEGRGPINKHGREAGTRTQDRRMVTAEYPLVYNMTDNLFGHNRLTEIVHM